MSGGFTLAARLALLFGAAAVVVFACVGVHLYQTSAEQLRNRDDVALRGAADLLQHHIGEIADVETLRRDPHYLLDVVLAQRGLAFSVWDTDGRLVTASAPDAPALPAVASQSIPAGTTEIRDGATGSGSPVRITTARVRAGKTPEEVTLVVAQDSEQREGILRAYRDDLVWTALVGALITGLLGYAIARRGLRSIKTIAHTSRDITASRLDTRLSEETAPPELQEMVRAFNEMLDRLEDSFRRLRQFSSDIAHELRTPLSNLLLLTQVTLSQPRSASEYQTLLASNIEECERLCRMVEEMLFLARVDDPSAVIASDLVDVRAELENVAEFYTPLAQEMNLAIERAGEGQVRGDRRLLQRAIHNLLSNALRYATPRTTVNATIGANDHVVELAVTNTGPGIPPEHLPHVFDRFYRTDAARQKSEEGAGLGLAIVKSIVQLHGGEVRVRSEPGNTTTFTIHLPTHRALGRRP